MWFVEALGAQGATINPNEALHHPPITPSPSPHCPANLSRGRPQHMELTKLNHNRQRNLQFCLSQREKRHRWLAITAADHGALACLTTHCDIAEHANATTAPHHHHHPACPSVEHPNTRKHQFVRKRKRENCCLFCRSAKKGTPAGYRGTNLLAWCACLFANFFVFCFATQKN